MFSFKNVKFRFKKTLSPSHRFCVSMAEPRSEDFAVISHFLSNPATFFLALSSWLSFSSVMLQLPCPIPLVWIELTVFPSLTAWHGAPQPWPSPALSSIHSPSVEAGLVATLTLLPGHSVAEVNTLPIYGFWKVWHPFLQTGFSVQNPKSFGIRSLGYFNARRRYLGVS